MNELLVVLPVSKVDFELALSLIVWIKELGGLGDSDLIALADLKLSAEQKDKLFSAAYNLCPSFEALTSIHYGSDDSWPVGPNWMWLTAARDIEWNAKEYGRRRAWLWLEPDCAPLKPGWLYSLQLEYANCGKPFMGVILPSAECFGKLWPPHMTGVGIYPWDAASRLESLDLENAKEAWDMLAGAIAVPHTHHTKLVTHTWGEPGFSPTFVEAREKGCARNVLTLDQVPKSAVLWHRCKDDSLRNILRQRNAARALCPV